MSLAANIQITDQDVQNAVASKGGAELGQLAGTPDGRVFAYTKAGAVNLAAGKITQSPAVVANDATRTLAASYAVGSNQITVTLGGTATQNQYADGWFVVTDGTGAGQGAYPVVGNTAATSGNSNTTIVNIFGSLNVALDNTSVVSLLPNLYGATIVSASGSAPGIPVVGAPIVPVTATYYYWSQVGGYASILSDGAIAKNVQGISSNAVAGAVETRVDATVVNPVGYAPELTVDAKYSAFFLTLA